MNIFRVNFFEQNLFEYITLFEKKDFYREKQNFCKNHTYFFLKNIYIFSNSFATFEQP